MAAAGEIAIGKSETRNRAAETLPAGLLKIETRLEQHALDRSTDPLAFHLQRAGRQHGMTRRTAALHLHDAGDGAVGMNSPGALGALETTEGEHFPNNETPRLLRLELFRSRRNRRQRHQHHRQTQRHHNSLPLLTLTNPHYAGGSSLNPERVYPILTTMRPRTCPSTIWRPASITAASPISWVIARNLPRSRSEAKRFHASRRRGCGHMTESMPMSDTARRMNGATDPGRSMPPARPQAATAPP